MFPTKGIDISYQYFQNGSIWLYGTITPQNETRVVITKGFTRDAKTAFGVYAAIICPIPVYRNSYMTF
jgi:hypothetical protein